MAQNYYNTILRVFRAPREEKVICNKYRIYQLREESGLIFLVIFVYRVFPRTL